MNRRSGAVSSDVVEGRFQARLRSLHRARLRAARPIVGSAPADPPPRYAHLDPATKCAPRESRERNADIARSNGLLVEKMVHILARRPQPNHDPVLLTKAKHATVEDAYRPGPIPLPKSLNKEARTRALEQIVLENEKFLHRLIASPGVYRAQHWAEQNHRELKYLDLHCKFPYVDPSTAMPAVNPMLAIANAQSNHTAEMILRNQQALAAQMQAQQQQMQQQQQPGASSYSSSTSLPQIQATGSNSAAFGSTHNSFGSTFGSTTGSHALPPMQPSSSAVPNHFPMPPSSTAASHLSPSPPGTAGSSRSLVPVQPQSARPATSLQPQQPQLKLRAQYTSQGVRIIKTGRRGGAAGSGYATARPATSLDPLRPAAPSSGSDNRQTAKTFQPLRTQQLQTHQRQQSAAAASEAASIAAASKSKHEESKEDDSASAAASSTAAPALPLFEDTLLISGRPVLVRLFEVSAPPRFEIAVFDPFSSLEYALSLPFTFVRMCFYQVLDLLLPHNRNYLVQTLLHYLVFAPAGGSGGAGSGASAGGSSGSSGAGSSGASGLELLVDIVAPPPRNATEAAAWKSVQAEAALEQQAWELANEKEAARARREAKAKDAATSSRAQSPEEHKTQHSSSPSNSNQSQADPQQQQQTQSPEEPSITIQRVPSTSGAGDKQESSSIVVTPPTAADDSPSATQPQQSQPQSFQNATPSEM